VKNQTPPKRGKGKVKQVLGYERAWKEVRKRNGIGKKKKKIRDIGPSLRVS
jgi:hypothetical protein